MYPETYKYTNDHEWIDLATGRMGITDYAQKQLGDIVFLELPEVGKVVKKGEQVGSVESVKAVSEIFAPISGTVTEINTALAEKPELPKKKVVQLLEELTCLAYKEAKNGFTLPGMGKLVLVKRKARIGRNPATGETIQIKAKKVVKFRVAKAAKDAILGVKK